MSELLPFFMPPLAMLVMAIVGLGLAPADFAAVRRQPWQLAGIALLQWPVALAVALALARSPLALPTGAAGLVLLAAAPSAPLANFYASLARAPVAPAVSVTALSSIAATLVTPLAAGLALRAIAGRTASVPPPLASLAQQVVLVLTLPLVAGMLLRALAPGWVSARRRAFAAVGITAIAALVVSVLASQWPTLRSSLASDALLALAYTLGVLGLAWPVARYGSGGTATGQALTWGFPARNTAIAAVLALNTIGDPAVVGFLAVMLVVQAPVLILLALWSGRRSSR